MIESSYKTNLPEIYLFTDDASVPLLPKYKGPLRVKTALNAYTGLNRQQMEKLPGTIYKTFWTDFMCEKIAAMRWAFTEGRPGPEGVWFLDADICLLGKLPMVPATAVVGLAPHFIRPADEAKYGHYNGGFLWMRDPRFLDIWAEATHTSRFFEQAALEDVAVAATTTSQEGLYEFPIQNNFGWWRLFQGTAPPPDIAREFGIHRRIEGVGLTFGSQPLLSVHTHFYEKKDATTIEFNNFIRGLLEKLGKHPPAVELLRLLRSG